ncbi:MAG: 1-acyl-sn-glycerol-3-phosphate acyltransferase [Clostridia bacterium]|nr:1-acyl-sn-glycerol-3-phosphate acyltransferase [Clostridia bacterium]
MKGFFRFVKALFFLPGKLLFPTKVVNKQALLKKGPVVTVSNHLCWADVVLVGVNIPGYRRIMAKKEIGKNRFIRWCATHMGIILIDRGKADMQALRTSVKALKSGDILEIFPEGTRNKDGDNLQEVKGGAAMLAIKGDAYIQPIMIYARARFFRKNYLYVAEPFKLTEFAGQLLDNVQLERAGTVVAEKMLEAQEALHAYVDAKKRKKKRAEQAE